MYTTALLRDVPLFAGMTEQELSLLAGSLGKRTFAQGMIIIHKDGLGQKLYIIESGRVRIFVLSESGQETSMNVYGPGDVLGELWLLDGLPRSAGAVALEKTVAVTLQRQDLLRHLETHPRMCQRIIETLSKRLRNTTAFDESLAFLDVHGRVATNRESVSKVLGAFRDQNLIGIDGQGTRIQDPVAFKARIPF